MNRMVFVFLKFQIPVGIVLLVACSDGNTVRPESEVGSCSQVNVSFSEVTISSEIQISSGQLEYSSSSSSFREVVNSSIGGVSSSSSMNSSSSGGLQQSSTTVQHVPGYVVDGLLDFRDLKSYDIVTIGTQVWMAQNLNYDAGVGSYCYGDIASNCDIFGRLYKWIVAMDSAPSSNASPSGIEGVCPQDWHLPSDDEWEILANYIANDAELLDKDGDDWSDIGEVLKANSNLWSVNTGTDEYGFSALPGGYREIGGIYEFLNNSGYWWSSTEFSSISAYYRFIGENHSDLYRSSNPNTVARSVRCIQNSI